MTREVNQLSSLSERNFAPSDDFELSISDGDFENDDNGINYTDLDLKSTVEGLILKAVPKIERPLLAAIQDTLEEKGLDTVEDIPLIEEKWLEGHGIKEMQLKKIMKEFQNYGAEKENKVPEGRSSKKERKKTLPLMRPIQEQPTIASRPALSNVVLDVGIMDLKIDFSKFSDSLLRSLEKLEVPTYTDRLRMVNIISQDTFDRFEEIKKSNITLKRKTPGREVYSKIVDVLFVDYSKCFEDTLNRKKFKDGKFSLKDQIETCTENKYRPSRPKGERAVSAKGNRSAACILPDKYSIVMSKKMQAEAESTRKALLSIFRSPRNNWDWPAIKQMLSSSSSLGAQRALINSKTSRDINLIIDRWPFLSELSGLVCPLDEITGISLKENFEIYVDENMDGLLSYLLAMSPKRVQLMRIQKELDLGSGEHRRLLAVLVMLAIHWDEDHKLLVSLVEESTLAHEVEDIVTLPSTPHIIALGSSIYTAKEFFVFLDQKCLCSNLSNALEALMCMCAAYFVFGVLYPAALSNTLTYFERMVANLSDGDGLLKGQTFKGAPALSTFTKVKKLQRQIESFEKELNGDD